MDVLTRTWYNKTVVGGFKIYVKSVKSDDTNVVEPVKSDDVKVVEPVCHHVGITEEQAANVHTMILKEGEHITRVRGKGSDSFGRTIFRQC